MWMMALGALMGYGRGLMQDQQTVGKIESLQLQAGWERDHGDMILEDTFRGVLRKKKVAYKQSISIMDSANVQQMQIKAQAERNASSLIVQAAGSGADVGSGTPLENAAIQMEVGDAEARTNQINARNSIKHLWDDVKWESDEMKRSGKFQRKMKYRKASLMEAGAEGLESSRGANMFSSILGGTTQGLGIGAQFEQAYGTDDPSPSRVSTSTSTSQSSTINPMHGKYGVGPGSIYSDRDKKSKSGKRTSRQYTLAPWKIW